MNFTPLRAPRRVRLVAAAAFVISTVAGCASGSGQETTATTDEALSAHRWSFVTLRRDLRKCASPVCGGYFVHDVNGDGAESYVSGIDYGHADLDDDALAQLSGAGDGELVLLARLGPVECLHHTRALVARAVWRGMPGRTAADGDLYYAVSQREPAIRCIAAPCPQLVARVLDRRASFFFDRLSVEAAAASFADTDWMASRVVDHDGLVAGRFEPGTPYPAGDESVLATSQVFVKIPARSRCAAPPTPACAPGERMTFDRDADRCLVPTGCVHPGICPLYRPSCEAGYTLASWPAGGSACAAWACDPSFLDPSRLPE